MERSKWKKNKERWQLSATHDPELELDSFALKGLLGTAGVSGWKVRRSFLLCGHLFKWRFHFFVFVWFPNFDCYGPFACSVETDVTDLWEEFLELSLEFESALLKISAGGQRRLTHAQVFCRPLLHHILSLREGEVLPRVQEVEGEYAGRLRRHCGSHSQKRLDKKALQKELELCISFPSGSFFPSMIV